MTIQPVVLGGDIGIYAIARQFHQAWGVKSICLGQSPIDALRRSKFVEVRPVYSSTEEIVPYLVALAKENPDTHHVLMANSDLHSGIIAKHYDTLAQHYAIPFPRLDTFNLVSDKSSFARLCASVNVATPPTVEVDMSVAGWQVPQIEFEFPVVAKAASGAAYDAVHFAGKRKIWFIRNQGELDAMFNALAQAGFADVFLVQQLIPGDNTCMRSITAYVDTNGRTTMLGSARVLLEDHAPTMIGNPVAMITEPMDELTDAALRVLEAANYRGFANFDVKIDPRDNTPYFFEVNPRIGRNSFYMTAAGINPMDVMVRDLVKGEAVAPQKLGREILYSLVPTKLLLRYLRDEKLRDRTAQLTHTAVDPLLYGADNSLIRNAIVHLQKLNHYRKFARYYPEATDLSF